MKLLLDLVIFISGMAFVEGLLKPLVVRLTQRQVKKLLPQVLDVLDDKIPQWLGNLTAGEIQQEVLGIVEDVAKEQELTLKEVDKSQLLSKAVTAYSFLVNAEKLLKGK